MLSGLTMNDPRLSSIHLDAMPRRTDYRKARQRLLDACGTQTLALDGHYDDEYFAREQRTLDHVPPARPATPPKPGTYWLMDKGNVFALKVGLNTVGRMPDNDIAVTDCSVSRRHCAILVHATTGCELHDTASKNGTYLNGKRISGPVPLKTGDEIRMCDRTFVFHAGERPAPSRAGAASEEEGDLKTHVD